MKLLKTLKIKSKKIMTKIKKYKILTPGYYFTYSNQQHPFYKDQTEKIASLYKESNDELIKELNTDADKVHGIGKFTHEETIGWFDSVLNPIVETLSGVDLIAIERKRQIKELGFDYTNDALYANEELAKAGAWYSLPSFDRIKFESLQILNPNKKSVVHIWPWDRRYYKPSPEDRIKELSKAGALIAAQIDCLQNQKK
jgi:hypothetical protein